MNDLVLRKSVIKAACAMHSDHLTVANSGNISVRNASGVLITPTGVAYESLRPEYIVQIDLQGNPVNSRFLPSSEWKIHCDIYKHRPEVNAIVHAHSPAATALSCLRQPLPSFHYMVSVAGGAEIPCADYATFGTQALSDNVLRVLEGYKACLMANHGMITVGHSLTSAYRLALEVESLCAQYSLAKQLGEVCLLTAAEMAAAKEAFAHYGQHPDK